MRFIVLVFIVIIPLLQPACSKKTTPEEQLRQIIETATAAAEEKDLYVLKDFIAESYTDGEGRTKKEIQHILARYFLGYKNIYLLTHIDSITIISELKAKVIVFVATSSTQIKNPHTLKDIHADLHRLELTFDKQGKRWLVQSGQWRQANLSDFLPE